MDKLKQLLQRLLHKEQPVENNNDFMYTEEQLMARLKFFIGVCLSLTLTGIVFVVLYSLIFVTQPLNAISPIDQKFFELIVPIATFLTGTLSGIMLAGGDKDAQKAALQAANKGWERPPTPVVVAPSTPTHVTTQTAYAAAPVFTPQVVAGFGGKESPAQPPHPEI
jgi:hypothetical protein